MNCAEKLLKPILFFDLYTKSPIEFMFRKAMVQETFKSILELIYQIIVTSIEFRKGFAKILILIALFKKFLS